MAIEKMNLVNIVGNLDVLDATLAQCLDSKKLHLITAAQSSDELKEYPILEEENPYTVLLNKIIVTAANLSIPLEFKDFASLDIPIEDCDIYIGELDAKFAELSEKKKDLEASILNHKNAKTQIKHMAGLDERFEDIFAQKYVKIRFGRLPNDSYAKLTYYQYKSFYFFPFDTDDDYVWGVYFAPNKDISEIDTIFKTLYFERIHIPDYARGTPEKALANIDTLLTQEEKDLAGVKQEIDSLSEEHKEKVLMVFSKLKTLNDTFDYRKNAVIIHKHFYLNGFVSEKDTDAFISLFDHMESVVCEVEEDQSETLAERPVKLKNNWFAKPFEMFVSMYGLPSYGDLDPTPIIAVMYTLLFGLMFGDFGQGIVIAVAGVILYKLKKMELGRILSRIGISSALFGILYGSCFGIETAFDWLYVGILNMREKPIHVFDADTTTKILLVAVAIGAVTIITSISLNIYLGFKHKDYTRALFSNNGMAGLLFYGAVVAAAGALMLFNVNVLSPVFIILCIVLPLLFMFFREPLGKILARKKDIKPEGGIGGFITENVFEMFEFFLSFVSNTLSFLRVGGFILSHSGMMAVVLTLSAMVGNGSNNIVVLIFGNIFVMCLEGLIVGIQVLRLQFYEFFGRFYEGNGEPFKEAKVNFELEEE